MIAGVAYTTCPLCEATCGLELQLDDQARVTRVRGDTEDVFSKGFICPKGGSMTALHEDPRHRPTHEALADYYERTGNRAEAALHRHLLQAAK